MPCDGARTKERQPSEQNRSGSFGGGGSDYVAGIVRVRPYEFAKASEGPRAKALFPQETLDLYLKEWG